MNYDKVQAILESDRSFSSRLSVKDTEVIGRKGHKVMVPALVYQVGEALKSCGLDLSAPKNVILATAASIPIGNSDGYVMQIQAPIASVTAPQPDASAPPLAKKLPKPAPPRQVIVKGAKPTAKPQPKPQDDPITQFTDSGAIHRFQCAIAAAQLLAAVSQLFEKDEWPGGDDRRKKLDDLIDEVEKVSTQHVNLSVKQIIRAQTAQKTSRES